MINCSKIHQFFCRWLFAGVLGQMLVVNALAIDVWITTADRSQLLAKQTVASSATRQKRDLPTIRVDESRRFQVIEGFGFALTGGSAEVINRLDRVRKLRLLKELFGTDPDSVSISYLRISIGASDLNAAPFTYNDIPGGESDPELRRFSLAEDESNLIPLLKEITLINPNIKLMASPWSAPVWMKDNNSFRGGRLRPANYPTYAAYFVKYVKAMEARGLQIDAVTPQNEPLHPGNNPSMLMSAAEQSAFVKNHLGRAFRRAGLTTKIVIYDHNCDRPDYPIEVLNDPEAKKYIDGSAFHLYAGSPDAMTKVRDAHPDRAIYFTEQYTSSKGKFAEDLKWHIRNVIVGATRNWSTVVLEWNLANGPDLRPHTDGGCDVCLGALTVDGNSVTRNVSYYVVAHAAKFVAPGSVRIDSSIVDLIPNAAFRTPDGGKVLIALNEGVETRSFSIETDGKLATASLPAGAVGTFVWR